MTTDTAAGRKTRQKPRVFGVGTGEMVQLGGQMRVSGAVLETPSRRNRSTLEVPGMASLPCAECRDFFTPKKPHQRYCSEACRRASNARIYARPKRDIPLSTGAAGALAELLICADLIAKGYEVFRAVSQASSCDILLLSPNGTKRVEVRSALRRLDGSISVPAQAKDIGRYDIMACVTPDGCIAYFDPDSVEIAV